MSAPDPDHRPSTATLLFLAANPSDTARLAIDREMREITQRLRGAGQRARIAIHHEPATRVDDLQKALLTHRPDLVHFSGHGVAGANPGLIFEDEAGRAVPVAAAPLAEMFRVLGETVRIVVLNACDSGPEAEAIRAHVDCVIGVDGALDDASAIAFAGALYQALGFGRSVQTAFDAGRNQLDLAGLRGAELARLHRREGVDAAKVYLVAPRRMRPRIMVGAALAALGLAAAAVWWPRPVPDQPKPAPPLSATATTTPPPPTSPACPADMVPVPSGAFTMGSLDDRSKDRDQRPHRVQLSAFCLDRTEVRAEAYAACVRAGGCTDDGLGFDPNARPYATYIAAGKGDHPINGVTWTQANAYCSWAGKALPTEAQWEYAARGDTGRTYPWGNEEPGPRLLNAGGAELRAMLARSGEKVAVVMYEGDDGAETTAPVGHYPAGASPFGALDMAGNVWEWVADWYGPYDPSSAPAQDPRGPDQPGAEPRHVLRGGGLADTLPDDVRATRRGKDGGNGHDFKYGLRCARRPLAGQEGGR